MFNWETMIVRLVVPNFAQDFSEHQGLKSVSDLLAETKRGRKRGSVWNGANKEPLPSSDPVNYGYREVKFMN